MTGSRLSENFNGKCQNSYTLANPYSVPGHEVTVERFERAEAVSIIQRAIGATDDGMWGRGTNEAFTQWLRLQQAEHMGAGEADGWLGAKTLDGLEGKIDADVYKALKQLYEDGSYSRLHARDKWHGATIENVQANCTLPDEVRPDIPKSEAVPETAPETEPEPPVAPASETKQELSSGNPEMTTGSEPPESPESPEARRQPGFAADYQLAFADVQMTYLNFLSAAPMAMSLDDMRFYQEVNDRYQTALDSYNSGDEAATLRAAHDLTSFARDGLAAQETNFVRQHWDQLHPYFGRVGEEVGPQDYDKGLEVLRSRQQDIIDQTYSHRGASLRELLRDRNAFNEISEPREAFAARTDAIEKLAADNGISLASEGQKPEMMPDSPALRQNQLAPGTGI